MKSFIVFAILVCVAHAGYEEATDTKHVYRRVWADDGERIVTFGYNRCQKAVRSKSQIQKYRGNSKTCNGIDYVFADCMKTAKGTCRGLFDNYLDYLPAEMKFRLKLKYPRTFYFHKKGDKAVVIPITRHGRMREEDLNNQDRFDNWCAEAKQQVPDDWAVQDIV